MDPNNDDHEEDLSEDLFEDVYELSDDQPATNPPIVGTTPGAALHHDLVQDIQAAATPIDRDLPCIQCGYNLRTQLMGGNCPECGTPVSRSVRTDQLHQSDIGWLASLRTGAMVMFTGIFAIIVFGVVLACGGIVLLAPGSASPGGPEMVFLIVQLLIGITVAGTFGFAVFKLTMPEPGRQTPKQSCSVARYTLLTYFTLGLLATVIGMAPSVIAEAVSAILSLINMVLGITGFIAMMLYARSLAARIPDPSLEKNTSIVLWGMVSTLALAFVLMAIVVVSMVIGMTSSSAPSGASPMMMAAGISSCLFCPLSIAALVFGIWWIVLLGQYSGAFGRALDMARHYQQAQAAAGAQGPTMY